MPVTPDPNINYDLQTKTVFTFATLPPAALNQGTVFWVSDLSTAPIVGAGATAVGGGSFIGKVRSDGAAYKIVMPYGTV